MIPILRGDQVEAFFGEEGGETSLKTFSEKVQLKKITLYVIFDVFVFV